MYTLLYAQLFYNAMDGTYINSASQLKDTQWSRCVEYSMRVQYESTVREYRREYSKRVQ
jgi:hypothetical protein